MAPNRQFLDERRNALFNDIVEALSIQAQMSARGGGGVIGSFGHVCASCSVRRDDVGYVMQTLIPNLRARLGLADRPDLVVKSKFISDGHCMCESVPCRCAIHRQVHVQIYPTPAPAPIAAPGIN